MSILRLWLLLAALLLAPAASAAQLAAAAPPPESAGIALGSDSFAATVGGGRTVTVFTYRPAAHGADDPIVILLPGGGRNGDDYRDSWIAAAERYRLLVLAPAFDEAQFPGPIAYNLAGMVAGTVDAMTLRDAVPTPPETWLFADLESIFDAAVARTGSRRPSYDLFGHSAGGQIAHRMVMFARQCRVRVAVAANAGWYTLPTDDMAFPYGLKGMALPSGQLDRAFGRRLVLLLGELDNAQEQRGHLRETPEAAAQGPHRLARGQFFHAAATRESARRGLVANWKLSVVPGVGHDYRRMSAAAADLLYGAR